MNIELLKEIEVIINPKLITYLHKLELDVSILKDYINILKINNIKEYENKKVITQSLFPELYQLSSDKLTNDKIVELIYDTKKGIPNLIYFPLKTINNYESKQEIYDSKTDSWKIIDLPYLKGEFIKYFIGNQEEPSYYSYENIKTILIKIINEYIDRHIITEIKNNLLLDSFKEDKLYRQYISEVLGLTINEISKTWSEYQPNNWKSNRLLMTSTEKIGILPSFIRDYFNGIDNKNETMLYLRYGSIGDGDCLFHSYLDMTNRNYVSLPSIREKRNMTQQFRKWLSDNSKKLDYQYLNPQLSYFLLESEDSDEVSYEAYQKHLKNCSEYGYDLDFIYLMNVIDYKKKSLIYQKKQDLKQLKTQPNTINQQKKLKINIKDIYNDKLYDSYNIFLFSYDLNRLNINNNENKVEFGKQFVQLLPHYQYQPNRNSIFLFNVGGMHFEGIIRIPLPKNKPTFTQWKLKHSLTSNSSDDSNSSINSIDIKKTKKKDKLLFNKYFDTNYIINHMYPYYNYSCTQYLNKEDLIKHLVQYIKLSGQNTESWESHPIRNWKQDENYPCEKIDGYSRYDGFRIPDTRGVCPNKHPWRFKIGKSDNFCCSKTKKSAFNKIKENEIDNNYKDCLGNQIPILNKITRKNIFTNKDTTPDIKNKKNKKSKKVTQTGEDLKNWRRYQDRSWVKKLVELGIINNDGSNFNKINIIYQNRPKGVLKTNSEVVEYILSNLNDSSSKSSSSISTESELTSSDE